MTYFQDIAIEQQVLQFDTPDFGELVARGDFAGMWKVFEKQENYESFIVTVKAPKTASPKQIYRALQQSR